jgi:hypothetical protein
MLFGLGTVLISIFGTLGYKIGCLPTPTYDFSGIKSENPIYTKVSTGYKCDIKVGEQWNLLSARTSARVDTQTKDVQTLLAMGNTVAFIINSHALLLRNAKCRY